MTTADRKRNAKVKEEAAREPESAGYAPLTDFSTDPETEERREELLAIEKEADRKSR